MLRRMSSSYPVRGEWKNSVIKTLQVHREQESWAKRDAVRIAALVRIDRRGLRFSLLILLILGISQDSALARPKQVEMRWGDLSALIVDKKVTLRLPEEVTVKGRVLAVRDDGLYLDIKKRNKKKAYSKGPTVIPRADVSLIEFREKRGIKYRAILTPVGFVAGAAIVVAVAVRAGGTSGGEVYAAALLGGIGAALGYVIGDSADTKVTRIKIVDDPPQSEATVNSPSR